MQHGNFGIRNLHLGISYLPHHSVTIAMNNINPASRYQLPGGKTNRYVLATDILELIRDRYLGYKHIVENIPYHRNAIVDLIRLLHKMKFVEPRIGPSRFIAWKATKRATPVNIAAAFLSDTINSTKPISQADFAGMLNSLASPASFLSSGSPCLPPSDQEKKESTASSTRICVSYAPDGSRTKTMQTVPSRL